MPAGDGHGRDSSPSSFAGMPVEGNQGRGYGLPAPSSHFPAVAAAAAAAAKNSSSRAPRPPLGHSPDPLIQISFIPPVPRRPRCPPSYRPAAAPILLPANRRTPVASSRPASSSTPDPSVLLPNAGRLLRSSRPASSSTPVASSRPCSSSTPVVSSRPSSSRSARPPPERRSPPPTRGKLVAAVFAIVMLSLSRALGRRFFSSAAASTSAVTKAQNPLEEFFEVERSTEEDKPPPHYGRSWKASELRLKSWDDLQKLWYVLLKEKNMLMTQRQMLHAESMRFPNPERVSKVKKSMCRIKHVLTERAIAEPDPRRSAEMKRMINTL